MDAATVDSVIGTCEHEVASDRTPDIGVLGFWRAVAAVKRDPELIARYADRIARIDREAFRRRVPLHVPAAIGVALLSLGSLFGLAVLWVAAGQSHPLRELAVLIGMGALLVCTHSLGHFVVGSLYGMRFTDFFIDLPRRPQPGLKLDYGTYLRAPARERAWMHAAGAIVSKLVPFAVIPYALAIGAEAWAVAILLAVGVAAVITDVLWSVKASDWKKFRREMRLAR
jgi:hypothetical protein